MSDIETLIADALLSLPSPISAEPFEPGFWRSCVTWEQLIEKATPAILAALKAARMVVVELPEPQQIEDYADGSWWDASDYEVGVLDKYPDEVQLVYRGNPTELIGVLECRDLALALLAAINAAEAGR